MNGGKNMNFDGMSLFLGDQGSNQGRHLQISTLYENHPGHDLVIDKVSLWRAVLHEILTKCPNVSVAVIQSALRLEQESLSFSTFI